MHCFNEGMAVILIQPRPNFGRHLQLGAFSDGFPGLSMAFKAAHQDRIKLKLIRARRRLTGFSPIFTQALSLTLAQIAQLVVVFSAKRSLTMAHQYQLSHLDSTSKHPQSC